LSTHSVPISLWPFISSSHQLQAVWRCNIDRNSTTADTLLYRCLTSLKARGTANSERLSDQTDRGGLDSSCYPTDSPGYLLLERRETRQRTKTLGAKLAQVSCLLSSLWLLLPLLRISFEHAGSLERVILYGESEDGTLRVVILTRGTGDDAPYTCQQCLRKDGSLDPCVVLRVLITPTALRPCVPSPSSFFRASLPSAPFPLSQYFDTFHFCATPSHRSLAGIKLYFWPLEL
jgi:hypothetical protein